MFPEIVYLLYVISAFKSIKLQKFTADIHMAAYQLNTDYEQILIKIAASQCRHALCWQLLQRQQLLVNYIFNIMYVATLYTQVKLRGHKVCLKAVPKRASSCCHRQVCQRCTAQLDILTGFCRSSQF